MSQSKSVVFAFGRFQPPTLGHDKLIKKVADLAASTDAKATIYLSRSLNENNPLTLDDRMDALSEAYNPLGVRFSAVQLNIPDKKGLFEVVHFLKEHMGYTDITMVCGDDRVEKYSKYLKPEGIRVVSAGPRDEYNPSGTKLREAARAGDWQTFTDGISPKLSVRKARKLFTKIKITDE